MNLLRRGGAYAKALIPWLIFAACFVPIPVFGSLYYPFVVPKTLLFEALGLLAAGAFSFALLSGEAFYFERLRRWETYIPLALLLVEYLASAFGLDFYRSFWGFLARGDGLLTSTVAVLFGYLILLTADRVFISRLFRTIAVVAALVAFIGFIEWVEYVLHLSFAFLPPVADRIGSTFGNAAYLASYLSLTGFLTLAYAHLPETRARKGWYAVAGFLVLVAILTATRGTILALILAGIFVLVLLSIGKGKYVKPVRGALVGIVILVILFVTFRTALSNASFAPVRRLASISLSDPDTASRLYVWENGLAAAFTHPVLGVGAEHEAQVFDRFYDPTKISEEWFDRMHNAFLDYFVEYGIGGLVLYALLIGVIFAMAFGHFRKSGDRSSLLIALAVFVYAVQNFFAFDTQSTLFLLFVLFGYTYAFQNGSTPEKFSFRSPLLGIILALVFVGLLVPVIVRPVEADAALAYGYVYQVADVTRADASFLQGLGYGTYADMEYGYELHDLYIDNQYGTLSGPDLLAAYTTAVTVLTDDFKRYPYDARTALYLADVLDSAPPTTTVDANLLTEAATRAQMLSPKRAEAAYLLANVDIGEAAGEASAASRMSYEDAIAVLSAYEKEVSALAEPHFALASLYLATGDSSAATTEAAMGDSDYKPDLETAHRAAVYYLAAENWTLAVKYLKDIIALNPADDASKLDLAKALYLSGDVTDARSVVTELKNEGSPYATSDPAFLQALGS